jgi:hypothetical protein
MPDGSSSDRPRTAAELMRRLRENGLVGMWADRIDIGDSSEYARRLRDGSVRAYYTGSDLLADLRSQVAERGCVPRSMLARAGEEIERLRATLADAVRLLYATRDGIIDDPQRALDRLVEQLGDGPCPLPDPDEVA